jgi:hypothetical protein
MARIYARSNGHGQNAPMDEREADEQAIRGVARAYLESWLDGDGGRMGSALHPMLAKRGLDYGQDLSPAGLHHLDREYMVGSAARGPRSQYGREIEITILDVADNVASVKVVSEPFIDYLHLARLDGRWSIVNVLYEDRQPGH